MDVSCTALSTANTEGLIGRSCHRSSFQLHRNAEVTAFCKPSIFGFCTTTQQRFVLPQAHNHAKVDPRFDAAYHVRDPLLDTAGHSRCLGVTMPCVSKVGSMNQKLLSSRTYTLCFVRPHAYSHLKDEVERCSCCLRVTAVSCRTSRVGSMNEKQFRSTTNTPCYMQQAFVQRQADNHVKGPLLCAACGRCHLTVTAFSQCMPKVGCPTQRQLGSRTYTPWNTSKMQQNPRKLSQLQSLICASKKAFFKDLDFMQQCTQQALSSLCILILMSVWITDLNCSSAFATTDTTPHQTASFEEVQLPPIPKVFSPLKDLVSPAIEKVVLPNGLRVFLLEDHELGLVGGQILIKAGSKNDPVDKLGLATISSIVQRSGGTKQHPAESLDVKLEEIAARIETSSGISEMNVGFRCLSEDLQEVMSLFSEVVQNPLMPKDKLDLARTQLMGSIKRRGENPGGIAAREFSKLLYGEGSAYSRYFTKDTLMHITQEDLVAFHKDTSSPTSSVLGIWGDFDKETVKAMISSTFSSWNVSPASDKGIFQGKVVSIPQLEIGNSFREPHIYIIDKPGLNQGFVRMGELGTTISDPDVFALDVLNNILNGFGGLLFDQVRSKEGLAYSVYGGWTPAVEHRGSFLAGGETQINTVPQFIGSVERVLRSVTVQPPSEEDLSKAKEGIINSFVFNFVDSEPMIHTL
eukprot:c21319_g1_i3 orf=107-2176(+)